jgi:phage baseplate assembly protein gpV
MTFPQAVQNADHQEIGEWSTRWNAWLSSRTELARHLHKTKDKGERR